MQRIAAVAVIVIAALGSLTEILSFAMTNGSFIVQQGRELVTWLSPAPAEMKSAAPAEMKSPAPAEMKSPAPAEMKTASCEQEGNLFAQKLCRDKEDRKLRSK